MEDIVSRLRALNFMGPWQEAADEIERLREALETFANNVKETNEGIDENWSKTIYPLKAENQRLRGVLLTVLEACEDVNSPDRKVRVEITKRCREALKEKE